MSFSITTWLGATAPRALQEIARLRLSTQVIGTAPGVLHGASSPSLFTQR